jgi:hypothetical protein
MAGLRLAMPSPVPGSLPRCHPYLPALVAAAAALLPCLAQAQDQRQRQAADCSGVPES